MHVQLIYYLQCDIDIRNVYVIYLAELLLSTRQPECNVYSAFGSSERDRKGGGGAEEREPEKLTFEL